MPTTTAVLLTAPDRMDSMTASQLDSLAQTPIVDTLSHESLAHALTSPPFVLLASRNNVSAADVVAPVACLNFRDASSATRTPELRSGRVYRAGKSAFNGVDLAKMGIVTVYDLRSQKECLRDPHADKQDMAGVDVVWYAPTSSLAEHFERTQQPTAAIPKTVADNNTTAAANTAIAATTQASSNDQSAPALDKAAHSILVDSYLSILLSHKQILRRILLDLAQLADSGDTDNVDNDIAIPLRPPPAILLHCTAGKDRTGVTVAMLASLAGCSPDGIAREYALTRIGIEPAREHLMKAMQATVPNFTVEDPRFRALSESRYEDMRAFLSAVDHTYGGFEAYAESVLQLSSEQIEAAKRNLRASPL